MLWSVSSPTSLSCGWEWSGSRYYPSLETLSIKSQLSEISYGSNSRTAKGLLFFDRVLMFLGSRCVNCPNTHLFGLATLKKTPPGKLNLPCWVLRAHVHSHFLARGLLFISKTPLKYHRLQAALLLHLLPSFCPSLIKPLSHPSIALELPSFPSCQHLPRGRSSHPHLPRCFPSILWSLPTGFLFALPLSTGLLHRLCQSSAWNAPPRSRSGCPPFRLFLSGPLQLSHSVLLRVRDTIFLSRFLGYRLSPWVHKGKCYNLNA